MTAVDAVCCPDLLQPGQTQTGEVTALKPWKIRDTQSLMRLKEKAKNIWNQRFLLLLILTSGQRSTNIFANTQLIQYKILNRTHYTQLRWSEMGFTSDLCTFWTQNTLDPHIHTALLTHSAILETSPYSWAATSHYLHHFVHWVTHLHSLGLNQTKQCSFWPWLLQRKHYWWMWCNMWYV